MVGIGFASTHVQVQNVQICRLSFVNAYASSVHVTRVSDAFGVAKCHALRRQVFVEELGVSSTIEFDSHDRDIDNPHVEHFLARDALGRNVGTCRLRSRSGGHKLERMCVARAARRTGVGTEIMRSVENICALRDGPLFCHAKRDSAAFYEGIGWSREGLCFEEAGIPHVTFVKRQPPLGVNNALGLGHCSLRTHDIERARMFYGVLGFRDEARFLVSGRRVAWIKSPYLDMRLELMEIVPFDSSLTRRNANEDMNCRDVGPYHVCFDASRACLSLSGLLSSWNDFSVKKYKKKVRTIVDPLISQLGGRLTETAMISDSDGNIVKLLRVCHIASRERPEHRAEINEWHDDGKSF